MLRVLCDFCEGIIKGSIPVTVVTAPPEREVFNYCSPEHYFTHSKQLIAKNGKYTEGENKPL